MTDEADINQVIVHCAFFRKFVPCRHCCRFDISIFFDSFWKHLVIHGIFLLFFQCNQEKKLEKDRRTRKNGCNSIIFRKYWMFGWNVRHSITMNQFLFDFFGKSEETKGEKVLYIWIYCWAILSFTAVYQVCIVLTLYFFAYKLSKQEYCMAGIENELCSWFQPKQHSLILT